MINIGGTGVDGQVSISPIRYFNLLAQSNRSFGGAFNFQKNYVRSLGAGFYSPEMRGFVFEISANEFFGNYEWTYKHEIVPYGGSSQTTVFYSKSKSRYSGTSFNIAVTKVLKRSKYGSTMIYAGYERSYFSIRDLQYFYEQHGQHIPYLTYDTRYASLKLNVQQFCFGYKFGDDIVDISFQVNLVGALNSRDKILTSVPYLNVSDLIVGVGWRFANNTRHEEILDSFKNR